jgi:scyllo-inositol 2-dehydrogenase (NADP+)
MPQPPIRTGLVSFGISSRTFHAPFLTTNPGFELVKVVERNGNESEKIYPGVTVVRSLEDLLADDSIELVVITSPNPTHHPFAKSAMEAGKHVVLEKPFANTPEEAMDLVKTSERTGKTCSVYHNRRYVCDFLTMQQILDERLLGDVHEFEAHYDRYRPNPRTYGLWREETLPGSGVLYDLGSHLIDQSLYLFGLPQRIIADIRRQKSYSQVDDYFDIRLDYGWLKVLLKSGMLVREMGPRYMIHGTLGSFIKYGEDPQEERLKAGELPVGDAWCYELEASYGLLHTEINGKVVKERYPSLRGNFGWFYTNLRETIRNGAPLQEKPEHGYNVVRMIELAFESSAAQCSIPCTGLLNASYR